MLGKLLCFLLLINMTDYDVLWRNLLRWIL